MSSPILVTGGTGTLGRLVVPRLREAGGTVRVLSRSSREDADGVEFVPGDLTTGEGIEAAVKGAEIIVHCAGSSKGDKARMALGRPAGLVSDMAGPRVYGVADLLRGYLQARRKHRRGR